MHNVDFRILKLRKSIQLFVRLREHTGSEKKKSIHKFFVSRCRYLTVNGYGSRWKLVLRSGSLGDGIWLGHWLEISGWLFALRSEQIVRSIFWRKTHLLLLLRVWWWCCLTHFSHWTGLGWMWRCFSLLELAQIHSDIRSLSLLLEANNW